MNLVERLRAAKGTDEYDQAKCDALFEEAAGELWCLREIVRGVRLMANAGNFKQWEGEPWLKRVQNIDLNS